MPRLKLLAAVLLAGLALGGCSFLTSATTQPSLEQRPMVHIEASGGHCLEGACKTDTTIARDGTLRIEAAGIEPVVSHIDAALLLGLAAAVDATDFATIMSVPFTGECPTAFDGQELTYTFQPNGREAVTFSSCEVEIPPNHPLFQALDAIILASAQ